MIRQIIPEDLSDKSRPYNMYAVNLVVEELDWLLANFKEVGLIFAKFLRMLSYCLSHEENQMTLVILNITKIIWQTHKDDCVKLGTELIRLLQDLYKAKEMEFITNDLKEPYKNSSY